MEDMEKWMYESIHSTLCRIVDDRTDQVFGESLRSKSRITSKWRIDTPVIMHDKEIYPLGRFRFIQQLEFDTFRYPIFCMQDYNIFDSIGVQMGMILDSPIPRGIVILPEDFAPLELDKESTWTFMNPLYALVKREWENKENSILMKSLKAVFHEFVIKKNVSGMFTARQILGQSNVVVLKLRYPNYLAMLPVGKRTVVVVSTSVPFREKIKVDIEQLNGKRKNIEFSVPSKSFLNTLLRIMDESIRINEKVQCDFPIQSKKPDLIPLLKYLVRVATQDDFICNLDDSYELLQDRFEIFSRQMKYQETEHLSPLMEKTDYWEISGLPYTRDSLNSRYAVLTIKCPKCKAIYNYSHSKILPNGILQCSNCLNNLQGVESIPNR